MRFTRFVAPSILFIPFVQSLITCPFPIPWVLCEECTVFSCLMNPKTTPIRRLLLINFPVSGLLVGRSFCSWVCPYGAVQESSSILGLGMNFKPSRRLVNAVRIILLFLAFSASFTLYHSITKETLLPPLLADLVSVVGIGLLTVIPTGFPGIVQLRLLLFTALSAATFIVRRSWCRVCPLGSIVSLFNKFSLYRLSLNKTKCDGCGLCSDVCQMGLDPEKGGLDSIDCIKCLDCVERCGRSAITLSLRNRLKGYRV
ncbi:4Fe-4S binding protein [Candidatus Bathyarchaeota archaeon]|nr:4Fe-4S binding protein [Candidatus Bathyarchaeota archaeon]